MAELRNDSELQIPEVKVEKRSDEPFLINAIGGTGLSHIVAVHPVFDHDEKSYYAHAQVAKVTSIRFISKHEPAEGIDKDEGFILYEVSAKGDDDKSKESLTKTIDNMHILSNPWKYPEEFLSLLYANSQTTL